MSVQPTSRQISRILFLVIAAVVAVVVTLFISYRIFGGGSLEVVMRAMTVAPDYLNLLLVNALVGISIALFVVQLRWGALRVTLTVIFALILGYFVTALFNLDSANRFTRGEFRAALVSQAAPAENNDMALQYGSQRGGEFNKPNAKDPLTEAKYNFEGHKGDAVSILAFAANRRAEVMLDVSLLDGAGQSLATGIPATEAQINRFKDKLRTDRDAIIEDFTLPADGIYTVYVKPRPLPASVTLRETLTATNTAYEAFLLGPLGRVNRWATWIQDALTLILVGLAIAVVFRARQFSLGAEGQLYFGALASGAIALTSANVPSILVIPVALLAAMTAGFFWGLLPGVLKAYLGANELVSTLMLNAIATRFYELILTFQLKPPDAGYIASAFFPPSGLLPVIIRDTQGQDTQVTIAVFLVIAAVIATWLLINRTTLGYEVRMVGSNRKFADYGGINTRRTIMLSMAVSGIIAGLAGAHLSMGIHRYLILNISYGLAFEGVVVALLARNNPLVIPFTGLLYAYLRAGAQFMERDANVSFEVVRIIQAAIILLITAEALIAFFQSRRAQRRSLEDLEKKTPEKPLEVSAV